MKPAIRETTMQRAGIIFVFFFLLNLVPADEDEWKKLEKGEILVTESQFKGPDNITRTVYPNTLFPRALPCSTCLH